MDTQVVTAVIEYIREFRDLHPVRIDEIRENLLADVSTVHEEFQFLDLFLPTATDGPELIEELGITDVEIKTTPSGWMFTTAPYSEHERILPAGQYSVTHVWGRRSSTDNAMSEPMDITITTDKAMTGAQVFMAMGDAYVAALAAQGFDQGRAYWLEGFTGNEIQLGT